MKDPLLQSLVYVSRFYGQANSSDALIADLPLADGLLTPFLLPRAAEKAGLQAKEAKQSITDLSPLLFPVIALLKGGDACVVLSLDKEKNEAEVVLPQADGNEQWIS
ncbi:type I secretion system permease/ATPase, partial [Photobacterium damselae subsp. damselae]|nr:type I secretion system permease/ATPase [Photobacterium damselae subsp. damselae]